MDKLRTQRSNRLILHRETLKWLDHDTLKKVAGGFTQFVNCDTRTGLPRGGCVC